MCLSPYFYYVAISLWVGIGGATLYSRALGAKEHGRAQAIFTHSLLLIFSLTLAIAAVAIVYQNPLAYALGADEETLGYVKEYMHVLLSCGFVITVQNAFSVFVRNDGNPNLAMYSLIVTAVLNVAFNYLFLFVLDFGVSGSAWGLICACAIGAVILFAHFFRKESTLRFRKFTFSWELLKNTFIIGFPSFIAEVGIAVFTTGYNIAMVRWVGTVGVSAFSILNYLHSVILMAFLGMGSAIQPLISFYRGAKLTTRERDTMKIAVKTAVGTGLAVMLLGWLGANVMVSAFADFCGGTESCDQGIRLFFIGYLFMGVNFIMMTYFQATEQVKMAIWITIAQGDYINGGFPAYSASHFMGVNGIWLTMPCRSASSY